MNVTPALKLSALVAALLAPSLAAQAGTIVAADSVSSSIADLDPAFAIGNLINQSGISAVYSSGVTDFDAFVATTKLIINPSFDFGGGWASTEGNIFPAFIDFVFAQSMTLSRLVIWNDTDTQALGSFEVLSSADAAFTSLTSLGSFTAAAQRVGTLGQVFDFADADTQYIRISGGPVLYDTGLLNIGEFAFESTTGVAPIPVPATALLLVGALGGLGLASRRRKGA